MTDVDPQTVTLLAGLLLLSAVILVWRGPYASPRWPLVLQGIALAAIVAVIAVQEQDARAFAVALLVLVLKAGVLPVLITRPPRAAAPGSAAPASVVHGSTAHGSTATGSVSPDDGGARVIRRPAPASASRMLAVAALVVVAYLLARPVVAALPGASGRALPVATALVLIGFLLLVTGRRAQGQLVGFLVLDNGIAATAFLATGGVPLVVELGVSLDVLLVVLVLNVLSERIRLTTGALDPDQLRELHD